MLEQRITSDHPLHPLRELVDAVLASMDHRLRKQLMTLAMEYVLRGQGQTFHPARTIPLPKSFPD